MKNKRKLPGICKVDVCNEQIYNMGICTTHFEQLYNGKYKKDHGKGKDQHPLIKIWRERHGYGSFPFEWMDFWQFVKDVGERPSEDHYFYKIDRFKPYSKENFKWVKQIKRQPHETDKEWNARRWQQRKDLRPAMQEYGKNFRTFLKFGHLKDPTHPLEEFSQFFLEKLENQKSLCAICHKPETAVDPRINGPRRLALDHCHKTIKIRDLLCSRCNRALGMLEESTLVIKNMIK